MSTIGDFNNIASLPEKFGGSSNVSRDINKFISFLNKGNLISLNATCVPLPGVTNIKMTLQY